MNSLRDILLQELCPLPLVDPSNLQDLSSVEPTILSPSHNSDSSDHHFVNWNRGVDGETVHAHTLSQTSPMIQRREVAY